jgi:hypothetical protein
MTMNVVVNVCATKRKSENHRRQIDEITEHKAEPHEKRFAKAGAERARHEAPSCQVRGSRLR